MASIGDYTNAMKYIKMALTIRKECIMIPYYNYALLCQAKYDEAVHFLDSICDVSSCEAICMKQQFAVSLLNKDLSKAGEYYHASPGALVLPSFLNDMLSATYLLEAGNTVEANRLLEKSIQTNLNLLMTQPNRGEHSIACWKLSGAYALLNNKAEAMHYLKELEDSGFYAGWHDFIMICPAFENLWDEPEFHTVMRRVRRKKSAILEQVNAMRDSGALNI
jgi:hypothetical protein